MSGQSAHLSMAEAKAMQERVQCSGSHADNHGGGGKGMGKRKKHMHEEGGEMPKKMAEKE